MKQTLVLLLGIIFLASCEIIENEIVEIKPKARDITLKVDQVYNDSTISLRWDKYGASDFKKYSLFRYATVLQNGQLIQQRKELKSFDSPDSVTYMERDMPRSLRVVYQLYLSTDTATYAAGGASYTRPDITNVGLFNDALINTDKDYLYLCDMGTGTIIIFNYATNKAIRKLDLKGPIGYSALGSYGGYLNELYVPDANGWLYILDALTLETKEKLYIGGYQVTSVVEEAGKLFVSSSDLSFERMDDNSLKVYDRATLKLVGRTGTWSNTRLVLLKNPVSQTADIELIDITTNILPTDLTYYRFNSSGNPLAKREDSYHGDHPLDPALVKAFPDGQRFITASSGAVYNKNLQYEKVLAPSYTYNGRYLDFAFNGSGSLIYGVLNNENKIVAIDYPSGTITNTYATSLKPYRIFRDGNQLICLTKPEFSADSYFFVEKINVL
ncbi:YncE family protein [Rufibacter psychrotolerans]|uniref:YncE family protein n=1 Tax=Rufibacter psychrotolerans TaxID=2812556 RepID=UPI0019684EB9|nr:hypothetical protein [Rufibacter sp. SYSU D00308]